MSNRLLLIVALVVLVFIILLLVIPFPDSERGPGPILLVHGFGGSGRVWSENYQVVQFFQRKLGLNFGGVLKLDSLRNHVVVDLTSEKPDFFAVSFSDNFSSIRTQAKELQRFIHFARRQTKAGKVTLIAFSMGGLTSRQYITTHRGNHFVKKLITIGTPHLGSEIALIYDLNQWAKENSKSDLINKKNLDNIITNIIAEILEPILSGIEILAQKTFFHNDKRVLSTPALSDLRPPRRAAYTSYRDGLLPGTTLLDSLSRAVHPQDIEYCCIIGDIKDSQVPFLNIDTLNTKLSNSGEITNIFYKVGNAVNNLLSKHQNSESFLHGGDGAVTVYSQDMRNINYFKRNKISVDVYRIHDVGHLEECWHHQVIRQPLKEYLLERQEYYSSQQKVSDK